MGIGLTQQSVYCWSYDGGFIARWNQQRDFTSVSRSGRIS